MASVRTSCTQPACEYDRQRVGATDTGNIRSSAPKTSGGRYAPPAFLDSLPRPVRHADGCSHCERSASDNGRLPRRLRV